MKKLWIICISMLFIVSCSLFDSDQPIPAYLVVEDVSVSTAPGEGAPTHNFEDVWVFVNKQLLGVYNLPARIPIIPNQDSITELDIWPGFRNNGENSRSFFYRLMNTVNIQQELLPEQELQPNLVFTYQETAKFDFVDGFEGNTIFTIDLDGDESTFVDITNEEKIEGSRSGKIFLTEEHPFVEVATAPIFDRANNAGTDSYLEIDFKSDIPFFAGVIYTINGVETKQVLVGIREQSEWSKIYIDYTDVLTSPQIETYRIFLSTNLEPLEKSEGTIYIDNLKFVHF